MAIAKPLQSTEDPALEEIIFPPGDLDSDEPELKSYLHLQQIILLLTSLEWLWQDRNDFFAAANLTVYYSPKQIKSRDFRGPDFFVALDTQRKSRKSWAIWEEGGKYPNVIVEILSDSTAKVDRNEKKQLYQDIFRLPDYFWFDPVTLEFEGFTLMSGQYQPIQATGQGWLWSEQLKLYLGVHEGQLRYFTTEGELVPTPAEAAQQALETARQAQETTRQALETERQAQETARQALETERQTREALETERQAQEIAQQQLEQLKAQLKALGVEPNL